MNGIRETYTIVLTRPSGVSSNHIRRYIKDAVETRCSEFEPANPLFKAKFEAVVRRRSIMETEAGAPDQAL